MWLKYHCGAIQTVVRTQLFLCLMGGHKHFWFPANLARLGMTFCFLFLIPLTAGGYSWMKHKCINEFILVTFGILCLVWSAPTRSLEEPAHYVTSAFLRWKLQSLISPELKGNTSFRTKCTNRAIVTLFNGCYCMSSHTKKYILLFNKSSKHVCCMLFCVLFSYK